mmetsp:Transcript_21069/g.46811  ORF Transcript_21069/g.46811 Transcript_21069/m.46811 type:complete len:172 (+) Transcript_21069:50-565(+)
MDGTNGTMACKLRQATLQDSETIMHLVNLAYEIEDGDTGIGFKNSPRLLHATDGLAEAYAESRVVVAEAGGLLVGAIVWEQKPDTLYFGPLATLPAHKGRGIGKLLMNHVYAIAAEKGLSTIEISVVSCRTDIIPMYESMGYVRCGRAPFPCPERLTRDVDFYIYKKQLVK